ncbi:MAG: DUF697 domain-containing protein [Byssovorax sp.]
MSRRSEAEKIINAHIIWAIGAGFVPVPILDIAAVTGIQLDMLKQLSTLYGVSYTESEGKVWLSALTGSLAARIGANALKLIPGIGTLIGGVSMSALSGASTYALGQVAIGHFEGSGTLSSINLDAAKKAYEEELEKGKRVAQKMAEEKTTSKDVFVKLERLSGLKDKGVISVDDYEAMKKKLLDTV